MSYFQDLDFTIRALDRLHQLIDRNVQDIVLTQSLWIVVGLVLSPPSSSDREVEGVSILSQRLLHLNLDGIQNLRRLALLALKEIEKQGKEYQEKTLEVGKQLSIDALYAKASPRTVTPGPEQVSRVRK